MAKPTGERKTVNAVRTTFRIIRALQDLDGAGVTELANRVGVSKGTAYNHLATLEEEEYVVKDAEDTYHAGLRFLDIAHHVKNRFPISELVEKEVDQLAAKSGEMALFTVEEHGQGVCLHVAYGEGAVQTPLYVGHRGDLHNTAVGKAILAYKPPEEVEEIVERRGLPEVTENTITRKEWLLEELEEIRKRGIAFNREETIHGLVGVGAPIKSQDGTVAGALSIIGPTSRMNGDRLEQELPDMITRSVNIIEINSTSL